MGLYENKNNSLSLLAGGTCYADSPVGAILPFGGSNPPSGYLICNGQAVSRIDYAELFAIIGTSFGAGDGSVTFNIPNLKGKTVVGYDANDTDFNAMGKSGGEKAHTLSVSEMPSHNHGGATGTMSANASHNHSIGGANIYFTAGGSQMCPAQQGGGSTIEYVNDKNIDHTHQISPQGSDVAHNNMQPYVATNYIIKAKQSALPLPFEDAVDEKISGNMIDSITDGSMKAATSNAVYDFPIDSIADGQHRPPTSNAVYDYLTPTLVSRRTFPSQSNYTISYVTTTVCGKMCTVNFLIKPITPASSWITCVQNAPTSMTRTQCGNDWALLLSVPAATNSAVAQSPLFIGIYPNSSNIMLAYGTAGMNYYGTFSYMLA